MTRLAWFCLALWAPVALAQAAPPQPDIHLIWMGGDDCPPCKAWRTTELPQRLLVHESHPYEQWDVARSFSNNCPGLFCVVGSKTFLPPAEVWQKVRPFIATQQNTGPL